VSLTVFLSHAWVDQSAPRVQENFRRGLAPLLRDKLAEQGVAVFYDEQDIEELDEIEQRIRMGVAASALFVCWYSDAYRGRRACNWELTAALATDPGRVVVVNPEADLDHILPTSLRGSLIASARDADDAAGWEYLTRRIVERAQALDGVFGDIATAETTPWYGDPPTRFSRFVGRAEPLWQLDSLLRPPPAVSGGGQPPPAVVVHGLGGLGKTALACEYATRFAGAYPGGIYWLRLGSPAPGTDPGEHVRLRLVSQLVRIADQLQPEGQPLDADASSHSPEVVARVVGRHLDQLGAPYLWVVDDLPAGLSATDFAACLPPGRDGQSLVTTQGTTYRHVPNLALGVMPAQEAVELLLGSGARREEAEAGTAEALAARLGHLPLALEVVGELVALPGTTPESLLAELTHPAEPLDLVEEAAQNPMASVSPTEHTLSAAMTFAPSINRLDEASFWLLATASALNVAPLPLKVIWPVVQSAAGLPDAALRPTLGMLLSRSLARGIDADTIEVHGLIADTTLRYLQDRAGFVAGCVLAAGRRIAQELGDMEDIRTHKASQRIAAFGQVLAEHSADLGGDHTVGVGALRSIGRFLHVEHRYREAAEIERRAAAEALQTLGPQDRITLAAQGDLGISLAHSGRNTEALDLLQHCAETLERCFGPEDIDTLTIKHNLAGQLQPVDLQAARKLRLEVYETRLRVLGPDHEHTLFSLHTLLSHNVVPPPHRDSVAAYEDLIARRTRLQGEDHTTTLTSMSNYTERLLTLGKPEAALPWARKAFERRSALYGPDHDVTLTARGRLLETLSALPAPPAQEIRQLAEEMQRYAASAVSFADPGRLATAGETLRRSGHPELAVEVLRGAQKSAAATLDPNDRNALLIEHNLAAALAAQGEPATAKAAFDELVPRIQNALGPDHRLTLRARRQQALLLAALGSPAGALEPQLTLASTWQAQCGTASPEYSEALGDIAATYDLLGQPDDARRYRAMQQQTGFADNTYGAGKA
jgi:tetratricopeptide (TPR) repeat protein